jgi:hypothetical protein
MAALLANTASRSDDKMTRSQLLADARARVRECAGRAANNTKLVRMLGGPEPACIMLSLASLDADGNGNLAPEELERYAQLGERLVESTKNFHLNAGVVAALGLSVVFGLAYEENDSLKSVADPETWGPIGSQAWTTAIADLTSFLAMQLAVSMAFVTVLLSSRMYTQISFWMPNLDSQLWFINESAGATAFLEWAKNVTLFSTLLALGLETAVTTTWLNLLAFIPIVALVASYAFVESTLSRKCYDRLGADLHKLAASTGDGLRA